MVRRYCALVLVTVLYVHTGTARGAVASDVRISPFAIQSLSAFNSSVALSPDTATDFVDAQFARLGQVMAQPLDFDSGAANPHEGTIDLLPAAPAASGLAIVGFLLVSFVRDRKLWLAAAASTVFCMGAAVGHVSKLVARLSSSAHAAATTAQMLSLEKQFNTSRGAGGDYYAILLNSLNRYGRERALMVTASACTYRPGTTLRQHDSLQALPCLTMFLNLHLICAGSQTRRFMISAPEIAFGQLARGPPRRDS